ncbi:hypothetical protein PR048_014732 [Dryococelus australis]|uniref:Uncharacterized protein n=1 Tax=Dryococelus australis TaxID=614101 RepID=A0ABQ9HF02_9NEOP|nr:hypothetical protein PR048_014732 [Dryococelus australis]
MFTGRIRGVLEGSAPEACAIFTGRIRGALEGPASEEASCADRLVSTSRSKGGEIPPTSGIVRHDWHLRKSGVNRPGIEPGEQSNRSAIVRTREFDFRWGRSRIFALRSRAGEFSLGSPVLFALAFRRSSTLSSLHPHRLPRHPPDYKGEKAPPTSGVVRPRFPKCENQGGDPTGNGTRFAWGVGGHRGAEPAYCSRVNLATLSPWPTQSINNAREPRAPSNRDILKSQARPAGDLCGIITHLGTREDTRKHDMGVWTIPAPFPTNYRYRRQHGDRFPSVIYLPFRTGGARKDGERESTEKTHHPTATSATFPACQDPGDPTWTRTRFASAGDESSGHCNTAAASAEVWACVLRQDSNRAPSSHYYNPSSLGSSTCARICVLSWSATVSPRYKSRRDVEGRPGSLRRRAPAPARFGGKTRGDALPLEKVRGRGGALSRRSARRSGNMPIEAEAAGIRHPARVWLPTSKTETNSGDIAAAVNLLASHRGEPGDDAAGQRIFSEGLPFTPAPSFWRCSIIILITIIGSQNLAGSYVRTRLPYYLPVIAPRDMNTYHRKQNRMKRTVPTSDTPTPHPARGRFIKRKRSLSRRCRGFYCRFGETKGWTLCRNRGRVERGGKGEDALHHNTSLPGLRRGGESRKNLHPGLQDSRQYTVTYAVEDVPRVSSCTVIIVIQGVLTARSWEPMRIIEVSMEKRRNERAGETGDPRENPPTNGIVRHDSHMRKSGERANRSATAAPLSLKAKAVHDKVGTFEIKLRKKSPPLPAIISTAALSDMHPNFYHIKISQLFLGVKTLGSVAISQLVMGPVRRYTCRPTEVPIVSRADLPWRSRLIRRRSGVREALGSNPEQGMGDRGRRTLGAGRGGGVAVVTCPVGIYVRYVGEVLRVSGFDISADVLIIAEHLKKRRRGLLCKQNVTEIGVTCVRDTPRARQQAAVRHAPSRRNLHEQRRLRRRRLGDAEYNPSRARRASRRVVIVPSLTASSARDNGRRRHSIPVRDLRHGQQRAKVVHVHRAVSHCARAIGSDLKSSRLSVLKSPDRDFILKPYKRNVFALIMTPKADVCRLTTAVGPPHLLMSSWCSVSATKTKERLISKWGHNGSVDGEIPSGAAVAQWIERFQVGPHPIIYPAGRTLHCTDARSCRFSSRWSLPPVLVTLLARLPCSRHSSNPGSETRRAFIVAGLDLKGSPHPERC